MSEVHIKSDERVTLRFKGSAFCPRCDEVVELLSYGAAARSYNTDLQDVTWLADKGCLHRLHDRRGNLMICGRSLAYVVENRRTRLLISSIGDAGPTQAARR